MPDVVDLIMQDHREVERFFDELKDNPEKRPNLLPVLTTLLTAHSRAEEAEVYPVAAATRPARRRRSRTASRSTSRPTSCWPSWPSPIRTSPAFDHADRLIDAVTHHVEEEETKVCRACASGSLRSAAGAGSGVRREQGRPSRRRAR